jgi:hypothetical protein
VGETPGRWLLDAIFGNAVLAAIVLIVIDMAVRLLHLSIDRYVQDTDRH